jgi:hypothetical protein
MGADIVFVFLDSYPRGRESIVEMAEVRTLRSTVRGGAFSPLQFALLEICPSKTIMPGCCGIASVRGVRNDRRM